MTDLEFIISDTPYAIYGERKNANTPLITYFPLSPTKGLFYGYRSGVNKFVSTYGRAVRDRNLIDWLNREVAAPLIGPVDAERYLATGQFEQVLCGGENYDGARPCHYEWAKGLSDQCRRHNVTFDFIETGTVFVKDGKEYR